MQRKKRDLIYIHCNTKAIGYLSCSDDRRTIVTSNNFELHMKSVKCCMILSSRAIEGSRS